MFCIQLCGRSHCFQFNKSSSDSYCYSTVSWRSRDGRANPFPSQTKDDVFQLEGSCRSQKCSCCLLYAVVVNFSLEILPPWWLQWHNRTDSINNYGIHSTLDYKMIVKTEKKLCQVLFLNRFSRRWPDTVAGSTGLHNTWHKGNNMWQYM